MKWQSVKEHEPPENVPLFVSTSSNWDLPFIVVVFRDGSFWYPEDGCNYTASDVSHFCIPDPIEFD
jgi:hypothetical protein